MRRLDAAFFLCYGTTMTDWPHAPPHRLSEKGAYMVTYGTYHKTHMLNESAKLDAVCDLLFRIAEEYGWGLHAWAILSNH
jgi:REP element-mobilizing transposase RayT